MSAQPKPATPTIHDGAPLSAPLHLVWNLIELTFRRSLCVLSDVEQDRAHRMWLDISPRDRLAIWSLLQRLGDRP